MRKIIYYILYVALTVGLLISGFFFEKPFAERRIVLTVLIVLYLLCLGLFTRKKFWYGLLFTSLILILVSLELLSKYAVNYFFHSLYLLQLILIVFRSSRRRVLFYSVLLSLCSFIKFGELILIQPSAGNIAMSVFFITTQVLLLLVFSLYKIYLEESIRNKELYEELLQTHLKLKQYSDEVNHLIKIEERSKIARDLHDTLGHELTGLIMQMEMASRTLPDDQAKGQELLEEAKKSARGSLSQVRAIVDTLKNDEEKEWTLDSLRELIDHFSKMTEVQIAYDINGDSLANPDIGLTLYRLVQEALTNAVRHGNASKVNIHIDYEPTKVSFEINDNGKGCLDFKQGNGIHGMLERVTALHGCLDFDGSRGFQIKGYIPYSII